MFCRTLLIPALFLISSADCYIIGLLTANQTFFFIIFTFIESVCLGGPYVMMVNVLG